MQPHGGFFYLKNFGIERVLRLLFSMLKPEFIDELRTIAFSPMARPANRVSACASLYRQNTDIPDIIKTLEAVASHPVTPDNVRIRAIDLLDKVTSTLTQTEIPVDLVALEKQLMEQYTGG